MKYTNKYNELKDLVLRPDPARIMEGLRDTGYDFNTAMADLVDNSIAAYASEIKISIYMDPNGVITVYLADNGCGMDKDGLINAMRYGSQKRDDPSSLGKFGLGLKTASTAFCRCLSLISKTSNSDYKKVRWDLDYICEVNEWKLLFPEITEDELNILRDITKDISGTLVVWEKVDRLLKDYSRSGQAKNSFAKLINRLKEHFSMVYQRFLDPNYEGVHNVKIYVNEDEISPWDPFCKNEKNTKCLTSQYPFIKSQDGKETQIKIEAWLLPRIEEFSNSKAKAEAKISNDREGFYIYRENRLIHYGDWLHMFINDPHISLLRIDFSFDHTLDEAFNIDIKKSSIQLNEAIYYWLLNEFMPAPRREAENVYRVGQSNKVINQSLNAHDSSNSNIDEKAPSLQASKIEVINASTGDVNITNNLGTFSGKITIEGQRTDGYTRVIPSENIDGNLLWEPCIVDGKHAVRINQSHPYYQKVYAPVIDNHVLITGMDSLLWALSEAELATYNDETKEQYEEMRIQVSRFLKKLVNDLPDPDVDNSRNEVETNE